MGSDFSALDAELDTLETGPSVDALLLARTYAGASLELYVVDSALNELDADGTLLRTRSSFPPELPRSRRPEARASERPQPNSEEIVLPDPVPREPQRREPGSGEMPLNALQGAPRSGSFSLDHAPAKVSRSHGRDDTLEPFDEELIDADEDLIEFTAAAPAPNDAAGERRRDSLFAPRSQPAPEGGERKRESLFAPKSEVSAQEEADAAFAELFSEATRESAMPSTRSSRAPEQYNDDTETFDTSALGFIENDTSHNAASTHGAPLADDLDSAEFEIVIDGDLSKSMPPPASREPAEAPEKRPSFLGRLFGRKEE